MGRKMRTVGNGLDALSVLTQERLELSLPETPGVPDQKNIRARAKKIKEGIPQIKEWIGKALAFLDWFRKLPRIEREAVPVSEVEKVEKGLRRLLQEEPVRAWRRAAWEALFEHYFSQEAPNTQEAKRTVNNLVEGGYLLLNSKGVGCINAFGRTYSVPPESCFERNELDHLQEMITCFFRAITERERAKWRETTESLLEQSELSLKEFLEGTPGKFALRVPPEQIINYSTGEPTGFWRPGGTLLVESDGKVIRPLAAAGRIEAGVKEAKELGVYLFLNTLAHTSPPRPKALGPERQRKISLLWYLLQRGIKALEQKERLLFLRERFKEKATVSPEEFFLQGEPGLCAAEFRGRWRTPEGEQINNVFFLVQREIHQGHKYLTLKKIPPHLKKLLNHCLKTHPEGEKFQGVDQPLGTILRAIFGQLRKAHGIKETTQMTEGKALVAKEVSRYKE